MKTSIIAIAILFVSSSSSFATANDVNDVTVMNDEYDEVHVYDEIFNSEENTCNKHCTTDSDCYKGGFVQCGKCGQYKGTQYYHRCYEETPEPIPSPTQPGQCGKPCMHNKDCKSEYAGTYNPCMTCSRNSGKAGTQWVCVRPSGADDDSDSVSYLRAN